MVNDCKSHRIRAVLKWNYITYSQFYSSLGVLRLIISPWDKQPVRLQLFLMILLVIVTHNSTYTNRRSTQIYYFILVDLNK